MPWSIQVPLNNTCNSGWRLFFSHNSMFASSVIKKSNVCVVYDKSASARGHLVVFSTPQKVSYFIFWLVYSFSETLLGLGSSIFPRSDYRTVTSCKPFNLDSSNNVVLRIVCLLISTSVSVYYLAKNLFNDSAPSMTKIIKMRKWRYSLLEANIFIDFPCRIWLIRPGLLWLETELYCKGCKHP